MTPTPEEIEAVARAIAAATDTEEPDEAYEAYPEAWQVQAQAAIAALDAVRARNDPRPNLGSLPSPSVMKTAREIADGIYENRRRPVEEWDYHIEARIAAALQRERDRKSEAAGDIMETARKIRADICETHCEVPEIIAGHCHCVNSIAAAIAAAYERGARGVREEACAHVMRTWGDLNDKCIMSTLAEDIADEIRTLPPPPADRKTTTGEPI